MRERLSSNLESLLQSLKLNHEHLLLEAEGVHADNAKALLEIQDSFDSLLRQLPEDSLHHKPGSGEWSAIDILSHLVEHDVDLEELKTRGISHYIDHSRIHLEQARKAVSDAKN